MDRRAVNTGVTLLVLCGLLVMAAVWGWKFLFADVAGSSTAEPAPSCATEQVAAGQRIRASQVRVSVFNGGSRSGLADQTMKRLERRGFLPGDLGNAPEDIDVARVQVWSNRKDDPTARLVARQFGKKLKVRFSEDDLGRGVDVILGDKFKGMVKAPRSVRLLETEDVCIPIESTEPTADTNAAG